MTIGILALQGDSAAHGRVLDALSQPWVPVKTPDDLNTISGLIIPGGESSTLLKLLAINNFFSALDAFCKAGKPVFGTCAGMILLARKVAPEQVSLAAIDIDVSRNAYGRQLNSQIAQAIPLISDLGAEPLELVFIRAPQITRVGEGVKVLIEHDGLPVLVQQGPILAASFHPELSNNTVIHSHFLALFDSDSHHESRVC